MPRLFPLALLLLLPTLAHAQKEYGFDNTKPSGQPYLAPEETVRRMKVHPDFEVKLFAAEPMLVNPIAFTIDEKGRVWAIECFEYPKRTPKGKAPRDRIVILEDTNGDGIADKRTVFAEGKDFPVTPERAKAGLGAFDLASGLEVGDGGCYVGAPPYLWHCKDINNDGKADKFDILATGFGSQDTHETLNTFTWGPDDWLYGLHGVFTTSKVKVTEPRASASGSGDAPPLTHVRGSDDRNGPRDTPPLTHRLAEPRASASGPRDTPPLTNVRGSEDAIDMDAAVWRYHPRRKKFEIFAEGTSNPWGLDFNSKGDCFVCCCVIPHLFHIVPGGIYIKQGNKPSNNPYAYGALKEICDHTFHKESGWAHAGLLCLDQHHMPKELQSSVIFGSIHGCSLKRNVLEVNGSTYRAKRADDFLVSGDKNFRPINLRWGPGGDIYVSDWHDQNPCHQTHPDKWDYERGRIYRIVQKGKALVPTPNLASLEAIRLAKVYRETTNPWELSVTRRLQDERFTVPGLRPSAVPLRHSWPTQVSVAEVMTSFAPEFQDWINRANRLSLLGDDTVSRNWFWRMWASAEKPNPNNISQFTGFCRGEKHAAARLELASTLLRLGGQLELSPALSHLLRHKEDVDDPVIPFTLWLVFEKQLTKDRTASLEFLRQNSPGNDLVCRHILPRAIRRLAASGNPEELSLALSFVTEVSERPVRLAALTGLVQAFEGKRLKTPPSQWPLLAARIQDETDPQIRRLYLHLAASFGDFKVVEHAVKVLRDSHRTTEERVDAIKQLGVLKAPEALPDLITTVQLDRVLGVRIEAARSLAAYDKPNLPVAFLGTWANYPPPLRAELVTTLRSRKPWAKALLEAVRDGKVPRSDLNDNTALAIRNFKDKELDALVEKVYGKFRDSPAELQLLLTRLRNELPAASGDHARGKQVFEKHCLQCHKFDGRGHDVGPNLDGAERSPEYLLVNVIDPNRVVGSPYFTRTVVLKNGKLITGLLAEEDAKTLRLRRENDVIEVIDKADIDEQSTSTKSLMPEGLANNLTVQDLRDLIRYLQK